MRAPRARASSVKLASPLGEAHKAILTDPQTSGGLLGACAADACDALLGPGRSRFAASRGFESDVIFKVIPKLLGNVADDME